MYGSDNGRKLKTASKFIAGFLGLGGIVIFILTLIAADSVTLAIFIPALIILITYLFLAWLSYHMLNAIGNTAINTETIIEKLDKLSYKTTAPTPSASNTMICGSCGETREKSTSNCPHCGFREVPVVTAKETKEMKMRTCPKCGEVFISSGLICTHCNEILK